MSIHPLLLELSDVSLSAVRIWKAQIDSCSPTQIEELRAHLDSEENARAARFKFVRDQNNYVATRGLLRSLIGALLNEDPAKLVFEYGEHGKPALVPTRPSSPTLRFSISHSNGWSMFAVSNRAEVGIDLESIDRLKRSDDNLTQLAVRIFSQKELNIWQALPDLVSRTNAFLRAWTRKEAYAKATGRGLHEETIRIEVVLDSSNPKSSLNLCVSGRTWVIHDLLAPEGFSAALAIEQ